MRTFREAKLEIEGPGTFRERVNDDAPNADRIGRLRYPHCCITEKRAPNPFVLPRTIDGEPAEQDHRDRIGHVAAEPARYASSGHGAGRERVKTDNPIAFTGDKSTARAFHLVGPGALFQPTIERILA